jgi:flagellar hook-length control protein FliK
MALTLQDLLTTTTDANATQASRIAISRAQPSSTQQHDPFAEFFKNASNNQDNAASSNTTATSQANTENNSKQDNGDAQSNVSDTSKASNNTKSAQSSAKRSDSHAHHHSEKRISDNSSKTDNGTTNDPSAQTINSMTNTNQDAAATSNTDTSAATSLFQVTLIAAQTSSIAGSQDSQTVATDSATFTPTTSAPDATNDTDTAPISSGDLSALLALQEEGPTSAQVVMPGAISNVPAQSGQNIAIAQATSPVAPKAAVSPTAAQSRSPDSSAAKGNTTTQSTSKGSSRTDTSRLDDSALGSNDDISKAATSDQTVPQAIPLLADGTSAAATVNNADTSAQTDSNNQADTNQNTATAITAPASGIATPQQAQTLYNQSNSRSDSLPQITIDQVTMRLTKAADDGLDHLTIHLKPLELGSIEVKLEMGNDGISKATITADRQDTLNLLQKDSHRLEKALENAGVKTDSATLSFNLRNDSGNGQMQNFFQRQGSYSPSASSYSTPSFDDGSIPETSSIVGYLNSRAALGGVDIRV